MFIDEIKPPKEGRTDYFDKAESGLVLRITTTGHKSWSVVYRSGGKLRRATIGPYTEGKARIEFGVEEARDEARKLKASIRGGGDPAADKKATRNGDGAGTFKAVADDWLALHVDRNCKASTAKETRRILERDVLNLDKAGTPQRFNGQKITEVTFTDIDRLIGGIVKRGAEVHANRVQKRLGALFNWAVSKRIIKKSP